MSSLLNRLNKLKNQKQIRHKAEQEIFDAFNTLHASFLFHITENIVKKISVHDHKSIKKIMLVIDAYAFTISERLYDVEKKLRIVITEESIKTRIIINLKFNSKNKKWRIDNISHKKIKYAMRFIKPSMIESFIVILTKYL